MAVRGRLPERALHLDGDADFRRGSARGMGDFGAHAGNKVGEVVRAGRAVAAQQLGRRSAEQLGERLQPRQARARSPLFPIADRGDRDAEPARQIGLAQSSRTPQARKPVAEHLISQTAVREIMNHRGATFPTSSCHIYQS